MKTYIDMEASVCVVVNDRDAIERVTGPGGDEWRRSAYPLHTERDVLSHWAYNALANGVQDASRLDGWADLEPGAVTMTVDFVETAS